MAGTLSWVSLYLPLNGDQFNAWQLIFQKHLLDGGIRKLTDVVEELTWWIISMG